MTTLLSSIRSQEFDLEQLEILIVANLEDSYFQSQLFRESTQGLNCKVLVSGQLGVNRARNQGIVSAAGELLLLLDDDCYLHNPKYLKLIWQAHQNFPEALAIGGAYKVSGKANPADKAYNCVARQWQSQDLYGDYSSCRLVGGNVSYKKEELSASGEFFDEGIQFGGTESEFHQRLIKRGFKTLFLQSLQVLHNTSLSGENLVHKAFCQAQGKIKYGIDDGFSDEASKTYHNKRILWARQRARTNEEFESIVGFMNLYDWAYNYTCENPLLHEKHILSRAQKSGKQQVYIQKESSL